MLQYTKNNVMLRRNKRKLDITFCFMSVGSQPKTDFDPLEIQDRLLGLLEPECHGEVVCHFNL